MMSLLMIIGAVLALLALAALLIVLIARSTRRGVERFDPLAFTPQGPGQRGWGGPPPGYRPPGYDGSPAWHPDLPGGGSDRYDDGHHPGGHHGQHHTGYHGHANHGYVHGDSGWWNGGSGDGGSGWCRRQRLQRRCPRQFRRRFQRQRVRRRFLGLSWAAAYRRHGVRVAGIQ